jgi:hypothetical protein
LCSERTVYWELSELISSLLVSLLSFANVSCRDESGTDIIRPTDRPKGSDTQMVRLYSNPDI